MSLSILKTTPDPHLPKASPKQCRCSAHFVESAILEVPELTCTSWESEGFAKALGYEGEAFKRSEDRRHRPRF